MLRTASKISTVDQHATPRVKEIRPSHKLDDYLPRRGPQRSPPHFEPVVDEQMAGDQGMEASALTLNRQLGQLTTPQHEAAHAARQAKIEPLQASMCRSSRPTVVRHDPIAAVAQVWPGSIWRRRWQELPAARSLSCV